MSDLPKRVLFKAVRKKPQAKARKRRVQKKQSVLRQGAVNVVKKTPQVKGRTGRLSKVDVLPPPIDEIPRKLAFVLELTRVETLLLRGIWDVNALQSLLNESNEVNGCGKRFSISEIRQLIEGVESRWELAGAALDIPKLIGRELASLTNVEREYWKRYDMFVRTYSGAAALTCLQGLLNVYKQRATLTGLDKQSAREFQAQDATDRLSKIQSSSQREKAIDILNKFIAWAGENKEVRVPNGKVIES